MTRPLSNIEDYAVIGDSRTAALVSTDGSIDWLCLPQFDGSSVFNRLLDRWRGGHFTITPVRPFSVRRSYKGTTAVLMTEFQTDEGTARVTDLMPVLPEHQKRARLLPFRSLLREVEGIEGAVEFQVIFKPRPDDGRLVPMLQVRGHAGYVLDLGSRLLHLSCGTSLDVKRGELEGRIRVEAGQRCRFWLAYSEEAPAVYPVLQEAESVTADTCAFWEAWANACTYHGPYRQAVLRSALTLKLLSFAPSGAIVAAATTSLPETIGGARNWDYRHCWLRDAGHTVQVFLRLGYHAEAMAFVRWLLHATALTYPAFQVLYDVYGQASVPERQVQFLEGYRASQPVRVGNQAHRQFQLDIYGAVLDSLLEAVEAGYRLDRELRNRLLRMADLICTDWTRPDHGIWEIPGGRRHYVHSKVMCWVALDRAERIARRVGVHADFDAWKQARESIQRTVWQAGYSAGLASFVQTLGGAEVDATALTFATTGLVEPDDPRMRSTIDTIRAHLGCGDLLYRYRTDDGLPGEEGAFLPCSFWLVEALAATGRRDEAQALLERLQQRATDVGLYSEEMDPATGAMLGNFPQALTHLAHIRAVLRLHHSR